MARTPKQSTHFPDFVSELWPTLALAYNNDSANHLAEVVKVPTDRIRTVGNPELDASFQYRQTPLLAEKRRKLCDELGLDPLIPVVFYADEGLARSGIFGWTNDIAVQNLKMIASACAEAGLQLLVRPRQGSEHFFKDVNISGATVVFDRRLSLVDSLALSCASVGCLSTVHETAIAMKKPLITPLWFFNDHPASHLPYMKYNAAHTVTTPSDLKEALRAASEGRLTTSTADYECQRFSHNDGRAAQRILQGIMDVAGVPAGLLA
jgi:hypothetical protein